MNKIVISLFLVGLLPTMSLADNILKGINYHITTESHVTFDKLNYKKLVDELTSAISDTNGRFYYGQLTEIEENNIRNIVERLGAFIDPKFKQKDYILSNKQENVLLK